MASSKMLLVILMLASLVVASIDADLVSSTEAPAKKTPTIDKDSRIMYHLLEGSKHKREPPTFTNYHEAAEGKKVNFVTTSYPKTEGVRHVSIVPNPHYLPSSYVHYQSTTPSPFVSLTTPPSYIPHNPYRKPYHCRCGAKSNYKTLPATLNKEPAEMSYDVEHVTQQTTYYQQPPQTYIKRKEASKKRTMACGERKLRKVKHVVIRKKNDSPHAIKDVDGTLVETH